MIPAIRKVLLSVLVYQNATLSKPAESGEIAQRARDRLERARAKRNEFCLNANGLCGKRESSAARFRTDASVASCKYYAPSDHNRILQRLTSVSPATVSL